MHIRRLASLGVALFAACFALCGYDADSGERLQSVLANLERYIRSGMEKTGVPGLSVAVIVHDKVIYLRGFGVRKAGSPEQVNADTVFQLASVSKPITSTIVASLAGTGDVNWDDRIAVIDSEFQLSNPAVSSQVTIRDLLSHRSGLATASGDVLEDLGYTRPEILYRMRLLPLPGEFRKSYAYSNFGYTEGAIAAAKKLGRVWEALAEERLFKPMGLTATSYRLSDYLNAPNKALGHVFVGGKPVNWFLRVPDAEAPAGSACSSARELAQWLRLQLGGGVWNGEQLVDREALEETHRPQSSISTKPVTQYYGLGWNVSYEPGQRVVLGHSGAFFLGTGTTVKFSPSRQIGIVVLTNASPVGLAEAIANDFFDLYILGKVQADYLTLFGEAFRQMDEEDFGKYKDYSKAPPPNPPAPSRPFASYAGTYHSEYFGDLTVSEEQGRLILRLPPRAERYELSHWSGDTFTFYYASETAAFGTRGIQFQNGLTQAYVEPLQSEQGGLFTKQ